MSQQTILTISGMHCNSCAKIIEAALEEKEGISLVSVDYNSKKAFLEFDRQKISIDEIKKEIKLSGYSAS